MSNPKQAPKKGKNPNCPATSDVMFGAFDFLELVWDLRFGI
jgi:hypothetical protein